MVRVYERSRISFHEQSVIPAIPTPTHIPHKTHNNAVKHKKNVKPQRVVVSTITCGSSTDVLVEFTTKCTAYLQAAALWDRGCEDRIASGSRFLQSRTVDV